MAAPRAVVVALLRFTLRIFFRRVEVEGVERVPADGPVMFVLNHPNSLVDPVFILCLAPRPVSFLAKAPLFRIPFVGWLVRAAGSIPVERRQDPGADLTKNREMFARVRAHLAAGGAVALFPEGTSHSDPRLKPMKTGAARIALGVEAAPPLRIQPVGLFYTDKRTFRSAALVYYGEPFEVHPARLDAAGEPPGESVRAVTDRIGQALGEVTLQADAFEAHDFVARTERILASQRRANDAAPRPELAEEFAFRRRVLRGYEALKSRDPARLDEIRERVYRYEDKLRGAGLDPWDVPVGRFSTGGILMGIGLFLLRFALLLPLGLPGLILHYLPYRLVGFLSRRAVGKYDDILATAKAVSAFVVFPLTWTAVAILFWQWLGTAAGLVTLVLAPLSGYAALRLAELADRATGALRALGLWILGRRSFLHLQVERRILREDILVIAEELGV
jgi:glycerol-3-phosphate O-acyltransferase / dihydroxyacetone phosphate acyltransferase